MNAPIKGFGTFFNGINSLMNDIGAAAEKPVDRTNPYLRAVKPEIIDRTSPEVSVIGFGAAGSKDDPEAILGSEGEVSKDDEAVLDSTESPIDKFRTLYNIKNVIEAPAPAVQSMPFKQFYGLKDE